jgi:Bacterial PH domain
MAILSRGNRSKPPWLAQARDFCRANGITVLGWGPNMLTVEAKTSERAAQIASKLAPLGFRPVANEDDAHAGMLELSPDPDAIRSHLASRLAAVDVSRRLLQERIIPLLWALGWLLLLHGATQNNNDGDKWVSLAVGTVGVAMFFWDGARIWGWKLEITPSSLRVRRFFRWSDFPWEQIRSVNISEETRGSRRQIVVVALTPRSTEKLGAFYGPFAEDLRDRLRNELAKHAPHVAHSDPAPEPVTSH